MRSNSKLFKFDFKFVIAVLVLLCVFLFSRFYKLNSVPPSVYWDEASIGYNAYSVANTLRDEWGEFLPLHFRAFGEFKLPVYIYSVALFTKLFGINEFSIRAPAVLYSFATILVIGLIVFEFFKNKWLSFLSSSFLVISPWFFIFSRTGYEVTSGFFFFALSFYLFLLSLKKTPFFLFSVLSLILTIYSYNSFRIISPVTLLLYVPTFFILNKDLRKTKVNILLISFVFLLVSVFPIYRLITKDFGLSRFSAVKANSYREIFNNYISHFSPSFLFTNGDENLRSQVPGFGEIWYLDAPLFLLGVFYLIKQKKLVYLLPLLIFLISFIPAALTKESPHALRTLNASIFFDIILIFGAKQILKKSKRLGIIIILLILAVNSFSFANYFREFVTNYSNQNSEAWQFGYKQMFSKYSAQINASDKVIISDEYAQPYIFALYYLKVEPSKFIQDATYNPVDKWGISTVASFGKFEFRKPTSNDIKLGNLIFAAPGELDSKLKTDDIVRFLDGRIAFEVYTK